MKNSFGATLKQLRSERGITQQELAKVLGLSFHTVNKYESKSATGIRKPSNYVLVKLADYFGVAVERLWNQKVIDEKRKLSLLKS